MSLWRTKSLFKLSPNRIDAFMETIEKYESAGLTVLLYEMPTRAEMVFSPEYIESYETLIRQLMAENRVELILRSEEISGSLDENLDYGDLNHLNESGGAKYSALLWRRISERGHSTGQ